MERLVLGTAQLGMNYGIANRTGQPDFKTAESIVKAAWDFGVHEFDTAAAYGESEDVLGKVLHSSGISNEVKIISKFPPDLDHLNQEDMKQALGKTLSRLKISRLYGVLLHREGFLDLWDKGLDEILAGFVSSGFVERLGITVYSPKKAIQALNTEGISIVQLPTNIIDRRFEKAGVLGLAEDAGKTIYIRSIFLQGLLLMPSESLPEHMRFAAPVINRLALYAQDIGLTVKELCIGYTKHTFPHSKLIFGAETQEQVKENMECWDVDWPSDLSQKVQREFEEIDEMMLNTSLWPKGFVNGPKTIEVQ
jgi:aryl-alcohol dehydrogenase-like predicted oxidoreductase